MHTCMLSHFSHVQLIATLPGSSVHGILQARILEWVAMQSSRGSSRPGIKSVSLASPVYLETRATSEPRESGGPEVTASSALSLGSGFVPVLLTDSELISACFKVDVRMKCTNRWSCLVVVSRQQILASTQFSCSVVSDSATPWTAAYQAPPYMGFSRQEYWSEVPLPSLWYFLTISLTTLSI